MKKRIMGMGFLVLLLLMIGGMARPAMADTTPTPPDTVATTQTASSNGIGFIAAALATGLACVGAGIAVAIVGSAALGAISENPKLLGRTIIFVGLAEGIAIYGLIISIMILSKI